MWFLQDKNTSWCEDVKYLFQHQHGNFNPKFAPGLGNQHQNSSKIVCARVKLVKGLNLLWKQWSKVKVIDKIILANSDSIKRIDKELEELPKIDSMAEI